jgi:nucleotide-binding universal stress UspA family protein
MLAIRHILFPVDFSDRTYGAIPFVQSTAARLGAKITLMSVAPPYWYEADPGVPMVVDLEEVRDQLKARLESTFTDEFASFEPRRVVEIGEAAEELVRFAHNEDVDLIMMPTHGYGPFRSLLLGSVTAKVLHDARCPVWTAAHIEGAPPIEHAECKNILCAVDATAKSERVMSWADEFAKASGANLRVVNVVQGVGAWPASQLDREFEEKLRADVRIHIERMLHSVGVVAPTCVAVGDVAPAVAEEARQHAADLVVIGRGSIHETMGRLRTHAYGIIRQAPCPVISV